MTLAVFKQVGDRHCVEITGHANHKSDHGDIVCAGVSALGYTLIEMVHELPEAFKDAEIVTEEGRIYTAFTLAPEYEQAGSMLLRTISTGLSMIQERYPDYVRVEY